jgi:FAD/FMN-containing dehydrogenase
MDKNNLQKALIEKCSTDASIFKVVPSGVVEVKSWTDVSDHIKLNRKFSVRAAGTCMSGGSLTEDLVLDILNMCEMGEVERVSDVSGVQGGGFAAALWCETGTMIRDLLSKLEKENLFFAPYTSSKNLCTLGGMLGNNSSGEKSLTYGPTSKNVTELKVILNMPELKGEIYHTKEKSLEDQNLYNFEKEILKILIENKDIIKNNKVNTHKNAAGYNVWDIIDFEKGTFNLTPLFIGSQGTLGVIAKAKIKTYNILNHAHMLVVPLEHIHDLPAVVSVCVESGSTSVECFDNETYALAMIHMRQDADLAILAKNKKIVIFAEFCNNDENVNMQKIKALQDILHTKNIKSYNIKTDENGKRESEAYWNIRRASFKLLKDFAPTGYKAIPIIEDTIVSLEHYDDYLKELLEIVYKYDMRYTYAGHIGDGSIRLIPLIKKDQPNAAENILNMADEVYALVKKYNGSISCDHNDGLARTYALNDFYKPEIIDIFTQIKNILDPEHILNPGKKVFNKKESREKALRYIYLD